MTNKFYSSVDGIRIRVASVMHRCCHRSASVSFMSGQSLLTTLLLSLTLFIGTGQMWGAITNNNNDTYTETSGTGTGSGSGTSYTITWSFAGGNITVVQKKGKSGTSVNSSYRANARVYQYHYLECTASNGFKIEKVEIVADGTNYGAGVAGGSSISNNVVGGTTNVTTVTTSSSGGTLSFTPKTDGTKTKMYIQNCQSGSTNTQLRWVSGNLKVTYSYTAPTAVASGTITSSSFDLSITDALNTNKYDVYFNTSGTAPTATTTPSEANKTTKTPTISSGVSSNTTYYVWARSVKTVSSNTWKSAWKALTGSSLTTTSAAPAYNITAQSNNPSYGTVSLDGNVITGSPATCHEYASPAYTVSPSGKATVTQGTGDHVNEFTVSSLSADVTITINFKGKAAGKTVNFDAGPGISASTSLTEDCVGAGITLPTVNATGVCKGWSTFAGWRKTSAITDSTTTDAGTLYAAGTKYNPSSDGETLYAVYSKTKGGGTSTLTIEPETFSNKGTNAYGSGAERTGTVGTISLGAHYITGNNAGTPGGSTTGQFLQCQGNNANIYNKTALPGRITQVVLNQNSATAFSLYCGTEQLMSSTNTSTGQTPSGTAQTAQSAATQMTWTVSGNYTYFDIKKGSSAGYISSVVITYSSSATYYCSDPNCCTPLVSINGSFNRYHLKIFHHIIMSMFISLIFKC